MLQEKTTSTYNRVDSLTKFD